MKGNGQPPGALARAAPTSPAAIEADVVRLREECRLLLDELSRRWRRAVAVPRRIAALPRAAARLARAHPVVVVASAALVVGALVWLGGRRGS